jgi:hypothetical protein
MVLDLGPILYPILALYALLGLGLLLSVFFAARYLWRWALRHRQIDGGHEFKHLYGFRLKPNSSGH